MDERKKELIKYICPNGDITLETLIEEFVFIENQLTELKKLPFIKINPNNPFQQKTTPAAKQYKELLQQYTNILKILLRITGIEDSEEESPLRKWLNKKLEV